MSYKLEKDTDKAGNSCLDKRTNENGTEVLPGPGVPCDLADDGLVLHHIPCRNHKHLVGVSTGAHLHRRQ